MGVIKGSTCIGFIFVLLVSWVEVQAQIIIKETIEVQPKGQESETERIKGKLVGQGGLYHPVLHRLGNGQYLVLKSGELKFYFVEAQSYGVENVEDHVLDYSVDGPSTHLVSSAELADYLDGPIVVKEGADISCRENQSYFDSNVTIPVGPTDDTYIEAGTELPYHGESDILDANGFNFSINRHPDQAFTTVYLQFGIGEVETNAILDDAYLLLAADTNITNVDKDFLLYKVEGPWSEETLSFSNRPPTNTLSYLTATVDDTVAAPGYIYITNILPFARDWLSGSSADHGIRIASTSRHAFSSKEAFFGTIPTIGLVLSVPDEENDPIFNVGYVQAGDTLTLNYLGLEDELNYNFTLNPDSIDADDHLSFAESTGCQTYNGLSLLPFIEEDALEQPYFEFVLDQDLTLPADTQPQSEVYIEPHLKFNNGSTSLPGDLFSFYEMELYDVPFINIQDASQPVPVALLDGSPNGWVPLNSLNPGDNITYLSIPEAIGSTFKVRVFGRIHKGQLIIRKGVSDAVSRNFEGGLLDPLMSNPRLNGIQATIEDDPNCGFPEEFAQQEGFFVNCFEFTIGEDAPEISLELPDPAQVWPTIRAIDGGNPDNRNRTNLSVTVTQNEEPVSGHGVQISLQFIEGTGGHNHTDNEFPQDLSGTLRNIHTEAEGEGMLTTQTGDDGRIEFEYTASSFSGKFEVRVESTSENSSTNDTLFVKVPNLQELEASNYFELVGAPHNYANTNDPCRTVAPTSMHNSNHWGTNNLNNAIEPIAIGYDSLNTGTRLRINDMSLQNGGIFDFNNNWNVPHNSHRTGSNADIGFRGISPDGSCDENLDLRQLRLLIIQETNRIPLRETTHYHIYSN